MYYLLLLLGLQNLPGEIDQNMQELRNMDEEFQRKQQQHTASFSLIHSLLFFKKKKKQEVERNELTTTTMIINYRHPRNVH